MNLLPADLNIDDIKVIKCIQIESLPGVTGSSSIVQKDITDKNEIKEIFNLLSKQHINRKLGFLSNNTNGDYPFIWVGIFCETDKDKKEFTFKISGQGDITLGNISTIYPNYTIGSIGKQRSKLFYRNINRLLMMENK